MKQAVVSAGLGLATQLLGVFLLATGMGAESSPPGFPSRLGYAMCLPATTIAGWTGGWLGVSELNVTLLGYLIGTVIWGAA
jgi:hypothetical protein